MPATTRRCRDRRSRRRDAVAATAQRRRLTIVSRPMPLWVTAKPSLRYSVAREVAALDAQAEPRVAVPRARASRERLQERPPDAVRAPDRTHADDQLGHAGADVAEARDRCAAAAGTRRRRSARPSRRRRRTRHRPAASSPTMYRLCSASPSPRASGRAPPGRQFAASTTMSPRNAPSAWVAGRTLKSAMAGRYARCVSPRCFEPRRALRLDDERHDHRATAQRLVHPAADRAAHDLRERVRVADAGLRGLGERRGDLRLDARRTPRRPRRSRARGSRAR